MMNKCLIKFIAKSYAVKYFISSFIMKFSALDSTSKIIARATQRRMRHKTPINRQNISFPDLTKSDNDILLPIKPLQTTRNLLSKECSITKPKENELINKGKEIYKECSQLTHVCKTITPYTLTVLFKEL